MNPELETTSIIFVCLGNICRSPLAEAIFLHLLQKDGILDRFTVDSAGTGSWHIGEPADPRMQACAKRHGVPIPSVGRKFSAPDYKRFDYIVAMDKKNRHDIFNIAGVSQNPSAKDIFLLRDFDEPADQGKDVPDPWFGSDSDFERVYDISHRCCQNLLAFIREEVSLP